MQELQIFNNKEFGQVRTVEIDGKPYFVGKDIATALGYKDTVNALKQHCRGVVKHHLTDSMGRKQMVSAITEGDMYRLITHSKLDSAERFESWIFDEVLPALRKTGSYEIPKKQAAKAVSFLFGKNIKNLLTLLHGHIIINVRARKEVRVCPQKVDRQ